MRHPSPPSFLIYLLLGVLMLGAPIAHAQTSSTSLPGISVMGSGQATVPAETAAVILMLGSGYYEDGKTMEPSIAPTASPEAAASPVIEAINMAGVPADDIQIIDNPYSGTYGPSGGPMTIIIRFDLDQPTIDGISHILDAALPVATDAGLYVNMIGVIYGVADCAPLERAAREDAIANAREQAALQADLLNVSLGNIIASRDDPSAAMMYGAYGGYTTVNSCTMFVPATSVSAVYSAPSFDPGLPAEVTVTMNVELTFEIAP